MTTAHHYAPKRLLQGPSRQQGQAIFIAMTVLMIAAVMLVILYNTNLATSKKMKVVNAADAAAYSAAIWGARQLNYMAYTNRAMIANHIVVGHFISYVSWIRYVKDGANNMDPLVTATLGVIIPAVTVAKVIAPPLEKITELYAKIFVPTMDLLNAFYSSTQAMSNAYGFIAIPNIMQTTARKYDAEMLVNSPAALDDPWAKSQGIQAQAMNNVRYAGFTSRYTPTNDNGRMTALVKDSFGSSRAWIEGDRGWDYDFLSAPIPGAMEFEKRGSTTMQNDLRDWNAQDELRYRTWNSKKMKWNGWQTIGKGEASAREFWNPYQGVRGYTDLTLKRLPIQRLPLTAYVSLPTENIKFKDAMNMTHAVNNISAVSRAEIYHQRPPPIFGFVGSASLYEHSNLYNPFWYARLIEPDTN